MIVTNVQKASARRRFPIFAFLGVATCLATSTFAAKFFNSFAGPYLGIMDKFYDCQVGEDGFDGSTIHKLRYSHFNPYKRSEMQTVWGTQSRNVTLNDTYWRTFNGSFWRNNQWKENWMIVRTPNACSAIQKDTPTYFKRLGGVIQNGACVMPKGEFELNDTIPNNPPQRIPILPYGRYRWRLTFGLGNQKSIPFCSYIEVELIPK